MCYHAAALLIVGLWTLQTVRCTATAACQVVNSAVLNLNYSDVSNVGFVFRFMRPPSVLSSLFSCTDRRLLFINCQRFVYRPTVRRSLNASSVALLLLLAGVEANPGPVPSVSTPTDVLRLGVLNTHSAVNRVALIHDVIDSHHLDMMVLTETWMKETDPPAITRDIAPTGFVVHHRFRAAGDCGGVAVICRQGLTVSAFDISTTATSFESLTLKLICRRGRMNLAAVYRPPSSSPYGMSTGVFCTELADFLDEMLALPGEPLICGDFNCAGSSPEDIDLQLRGVFLELRQLE